MALLDTRDPALPTTNKLEFSAAEIGAFAHPTAVKSTEALSGARAHELGGSYDWHCLIRDFQQCRSLTPAPGARWPNRQCIPSVGGPSLPVFQCLAGTRAPTRNRFLRAMIRGEGIRLGLPWTELLAKDYCDPRYHISS